MNKNIILLVVLFALYFITGFTLQAIYGEAFHFMESENYWSPDGNGGWVEYGNPSGTMPSDPSVLPPLIVFYLPFFIPAFVLILFMFTPLSKCLEAKKKDDEDEEVTSIES